MVNYIIFVSICLLTTKKVWSEDKRQETTISIRGEPKSGTTWLEIIAFEAAQQLCNGKSEISSHREKSCKALTDVSNNKKRSFSIDVNHTHIYHFNVWFKHQIPGIELKQYNCTHLKERNSKEFLTYSQLRSYCIPNCLSNRSLSPDTNHLHILRDPREVTVSACFWENSKWHDLNTTSDTITKKLSKCIKAKLEEILLKTKYRELAIEKIYGNSRNTICYEELLIPTHAIMGFRKIIRSLGLYATDATIENIINATSAEIIKRGGSAYNMFDLDDGRVPKVRAAGAKTYLDYNMDNATLAWINNKYIDAEAFFQSPCRAYRDLYFSEKVDPT